jgi:hypothetical protein
VDETHVARIPRLPPVPAPQRIQPVPGRAPIPTVHGGCRRHHRTESPGVDPEQPGSDPGGHLPGAGRLLGHQFRCRKRRRRRRTRRREEDEEEDEDEDEGEDEGEDEDEEEDKDKDEDEEVTIIEI